MSNRHLVPMPKVKPHGPSRPAPAAAIAPSGLQTWHCFAFLIVAAIVWYFIRWPFIVIGSFAAFVWALIWLSQRFPRTMLFIMVFFNTLFRR